MKPPNKTRTKAIDKATLQALRASHKFHTIKLGNKCAYCGVYGDHREHVIPISFLSISRKSLADRNYIKNNLVRSCSECNLCANSIVFENFWEKKRYISEWVQNRYRNLLYSPDWKDEEIEELQGQLKRFIKSCKTMKEFIKARIDNLNKPEICQ
jgi:hypothetical protein